MSWPQPTYAQYREWGGSVDEGVFDDLVRRAVSTVAHECWPNEPDADDAEMVSHAINAVCAAIEVDVAYGGTGGGALAEGGFTLGSFTVGSGTNMRGAGMEGTYSADMSAAIRRELVGTGLLGKVIV